VSSNFLATKHRWTLTPLVCPDIPLPQSLFHTPAGIKDAEGKRCIVWRLGFHGFRPTQGWRISGCHSAVLPGIQTSKLTGTAL